MEENKIVNVDDAAIIIKEAIVRSRFQAVKLVNKELLGLYYAVGRYVSDNSRIGSWGKGAIRQLSDELQKKLPGLRGFSEGAIKKMRLFYEEWSSVFLNRSSPMNDLHSGETAAISKSDFNIDLSLLEDHIIKCANVSSEKFYMVGFTHHYTIMAKEKSLEGRLFYIAHCAENFWTVEILKSNLYGELYLHIGTMSSNFLQTLPEHEQARRAIRTFKDEYLLDFVNIEPDIDPDDRDERVFERNIVANIKQFILSFGRNFSFIGNQYRVMVDEEEFFIDLLFFNRELRCLVAVELKRGIFKPSHLGQLNFYLSALDEYVRLPDESPSIGILLCKEANRSIVEFAVRDYTKPMGVATYRTRNEMPSKWQKALPDFEDMRNLLENVGDEQNGEMVNE